MIHGVNDMLKRFIRYYGPHKKMLALDMIAALFISVIGMAYPILTNRMLNIYVQNRMYKAIIISGVAMLALYTVRMMLRYFVQFYGHMIGVKMQSQMRQDLLHTWKSCRSAFSMRTRPGGS